MVIDEPDIPCQRCGSFGATAYLGWALLCQACQQSDNDWYEDE